MKTIARVLLLTVFTATLSLNSYSQVWQFSTSGHITSVIGEFSDADMANPNAGYVDYADGGYLELKYYKNKLGWGIRTSYTIYHRDNETYLNDLKSELGITGNGYYSTLSNNYWALGADFGVSYPLVLNDRFQFEPYFYLGFKGLLTPLDEVVYLDNSSTYTYRTNPLLFVGIAYIPGIKAQWNVTKHFGINIYAEYEGLNLISENEESVLYSSSTLDVTSRERTLKPKLVNIGLGFSFSFGKGLGE